MNPNTLSLRTIVLAIVGLSLALLPPRLGAVNFTWTGGGTDNNWNTAANWGGSALAGGAANNLIFNGSAGLNNTNNLSGLTNGWVQFNNGNFILGGNPWTLSPSGAAVITNLAGTNVLALNLNLVPAGKYWYVASNSEVQLAGTLTNPAAGGTATGWLFLTNGGTVRIMSLAQSARGMDLFQGTVIVDGGYVDQFNDGVRFKAAAGQVVTTRIVNNGTWRLGQGGNFRMGDTGSQAGSLSQMFLESGSLQMYNGTSGGGTVFVSDRAAMKSVFNLNGGMVWGPALGTGVTLALGNAANADGTFNLNGGLLWVGQIRQANSGATNVVFNFNGGTLMPWASSTTFMQGLLTAQIQNGGAIIDTTNFNITIAQNLQAAGSGGLTKLGSGTLTLGGYNTYTGPTVVSNGTLATSSSSFAGGGALTVAGGANLSVAYLGNPITVSSLNIGSTVTNSVTLDFGTTPYPNGSVFISAATLTGTGTALLNIAGSSAGFVSGSYPLITFGSATGLSALRLGTLPSGVAGTLVQSGNTLSLKVALVPKLLEWSGALNGQWDTNTLNWYDTGNGNNPTNYAQSAGTGDLVTFDDNVTAGRTTVELTTALTPAQVIVNNNTPYTFVGSGRLSGSAGLTKASGGSLTLSTVNDYTGGTVLQGGNLFLGNDQALGQGPLQFDGLGAELASASTANRSVSNTVVLTANATSIALGDAANTGTLTLFGTFDFGSLAARTLTFNSDVVLSGPIVNSGGGIGSLNGAGRLIITGQGRVGVSGTVVTHNGADLIVDGGVLQVGDGWRLQAVTPNSALRLAITNGGAFIMTNTATENFRVGYGGDNTATNIFDVGGTVIVYGTGVNGSVVLGQSGAADTLNLWSGGALTCNTISQNGAAVTTFNAYGGTVSPIYSSTTFLQGLSNAYIWNGLTVDTANLNITIAQPLLAGGAGGLTKNGAGTLTLAGTNTYLGGTVVNGGTLMLTTSSVTGGGPLTVASNAALYVSWTGSPLATSALNLGSGGTNSLTCDFGGAPYPNGNPVFSAVSLSGGGSTAVNIVGTNFISGSYPLISFGSGTGLSAFSLGTVPSGITASLVKTANQITLNVAATKNLKWRGGVNGDWDTVTFNWFDLGGNRLTNYAQTSGIGDPVTFDDTVGTGTTAINLPITVTPTAITANNSAYSYTIAGAGKISGPASFTKAAASLGAFTLGTANDYAGGTILQGGTLLVGHDLALGQGPLLFDSAAATLACANSTGHALSNTVVLTANATNAVFGDAIKSGTLTINGTFDFGAVANRGLTLNSDVVVGGPLVNSGGGISSLNGAGRFIIKGQGQASVPGTVVTHNGSDVIVDGGTLQAGDGWRMQATNAGSSLLFAVTNGGSFIMTNTATENFRLGYAGDTTASHTLDIAGTVFLYGTGGNGSVIMGQSSAAATLNLRAGGTLICNAITLNGPAQTTLNFYGGTLKPIASVTTFMQGLGNAFIWDGLTVDTTDLDITIGQSLLAGGAGGLTKLGTGALTLSGANTYTGGTVVSNGTLILDPAGQLAATTNLVLAGSSVLDVSGAGSWTLGATQTLSGVGTVLGVVVAAGTVAPGNPTGVLAFGNDLTLGGRTVVNVTRSDGATNGAIQVTGALAYGGQLQVLLAGPAPLAVNDTFKLFSFSAAPTGAFATMSLPAGYTWATDRLAVDGTIKVTAVLTPSRPRITSARLAGGAVILSGTNGASGGPFYILGATNVALPLANWTPLLTNTFDAAGNFSVTNTVVPSAKAMFYLLRQ